MPNRLQTQAAVTCMKILLMLFNVVFWATGCAILTIGIWMKMEVHKYLDVDPSNPVTSTVAYVFIGLGCGIALTGMFACCCTLSGNSILLYIYSAFLCVIFVIQLSSGIAWFAYRNTLKESLRKGLSTTMSRYESGAEYATAIDTLQITLKCCGITDFHDWLKDPHHGVPISCCRNPDDLKCNTGDLDSIYTDGCYTTVVDFMNTNMKLMGGIALGIAFFQLLGVALTCCLAKNINKAKYEPMN